MWGRDSRGQCPLGHSTHHCNNFVQWSPPKPPSKACLRFGFSIEVRLFSLFKCFVPFNVQKKKTWYSFTILLLSHSKLMWTDKLLSVSCFNISFRTGVDVLNVSWMSELWISLLYNAETTEVVYEVRILGTFRKIAFIINSFFKTQGGGQLQFRAEHFHRHFDRAQSSLKTNSPLFSKNIRTFNKA